MTARKSKSKADEPEVREPISTETESGDSYGGAQMPVGGLHIAKGWGDSDE